MITLVQTLMRLCAQVPALAALLTLLIGLVSPAHAQPLDWRYSIQVGAAVTTLEGDGASEAGALVGFSLNGTVGLRLFGPLYAQTGLRFVQKGFAYDEDEVDPDLDFAEDSSLEFRTGFIQIPLLLRAYLPDVGPVRPSLFAGPAFGLASTDRLSVEEDDVTVTRDVDVFESTEVSGVVGIGVSFEVPYVQRVIIEGQFERGFTDATKVRLLPGEDDPFATRTQALVFTLGIVLQ